jgi:hypothetical protein
MTAHRGVDPGLEQAGLQHRGMGFRRVIVGHLHGLERRCEVVQIEQVGQPPARLARRHAKQGQGLGRQRGQAVPRARIERREHDALTGLVQLAKAAL